jgi:hypothetical protein
VDRRHGAVSFFLIRNGRRPRVALRCNAICEVGDAWWTVVVGVHRAYLSRQLIVATVVSIVCPLRRDSTGQALCLLWLVALSTLSV